MALRGHNRGPGGGGGCVVPPRLGVSRFTVLSRFFVMLGFVFCKLFEHYSKTHFPIIKTKPFKVTKYLNSIADIYAKVGEDKNLCHYFIFVIKNLNKDTHYKYT